MAPDFKFSYFDGGRPERSLSASIAEEQRGAGILHFRLHRGLNPQMKNFQQNLKKLEAADTQVLGVSMDSPFANKAFADPIGVTFPLLSDWGGEPPASTEFTSTNTKPRAA